MLLSAKRWSVEECHRIGFVDRIVAPGEVLQAVIEELEPLLKYPYDSLEGILSMVKGGVSERDVFLSLWGKEAHRKALGIG